MQAGFAVLVGVVQFRAHTSVNSSSTCDPSNTRFNRTTSERKLTTCFHGVALHLCSRSSFPRHHIRFYKRLPSLKAKAAKEDDAFDRFSSTLKTPPLKTLIAVLKQLWPSGEPHLRIRVTAAVVCLLLSKVTTVQVPLLFKKAVDSLTKTHDPILVAPVSFAW